MQDWKVTDEIARVDIAGLENDKPVYATSTVTCNDENM